MQLQHLNGILMLSLFPLDGGGLFCGVLQGMHNVRWIDIPVYAVETASSTFFVAAIDAEKVVKIDTIAKSLGARSVFDVMI